MNKVLARFTLLTLLLSYSLQATHVLKNDILKPEASKMIEDMAVELLSKTGINGYVVATNENFPERFNLVEYSTRYESNISKPFVLFIFAPNAVITKKSGKTGRVAFIPSSDAVQNLYNKSDVMDAAIDVIAVQDKNKIEDKHNIGVVQGFSELSDHIATSKGVEMTTTLPNETRLVVSILEVIVGIGSIFIFWIFIFRPIYTRIRNGKE